MIQVEDLIGMGDPVNVPGTDTEHPNWQRKVTQDTAGIFCARRGAGYSRGGEQRPSRRESQYLSPTPEVRMHRSRLAGFIMDCRTDDLEQAAQFWSAALGVPLKPAAEESSPLYRQLMTKDGLHVEVQKVEHESRVHIDIETDDIEAEVRRLEALGAKRVGTVHTWCVMQAPTGQRFCVVRPQRGGLQRAGERLEIAGGSLNSTDVTVTDRRQYRVGGSMARSLGV